jgi:hypothetical protein
LLSSERKYFNAYLPYMSAHAHQFKSLIPEANAHDLSQRGYTIRPFLSAGEILALSRLHAETTPNVPADYYPTAFGSDPSLKLRIFDGIMEIVQPKVKDLAPGYRILNASFVTKRARSVNGRLGLHQDLSLVDHARHLGLNVWCPLCDVDNHNGCLRVAAGSHVFGHISANPPNPSPYDHVRNELETIYMIDTPMAAGSAFLFDTRLLHATEENDTDSDRTSVFLNLGPDGVPARFYQWNKWQPDSLEIYEIDTDFVVRFRPNQYVENAAMLGAKFIGLIDYSYKPLTSADLSSLLPLSGSRPHEGRLHHAMRRAMLFLSQRSPTYHR